MKVFWMPGIYFGTLNIVNEYILVYQNISLSAILRNVLFKVSPLKI